MNNVMAMDIGGTHFRVGLFDDAGRRLEVLEGDTSRSGGRDWMLEQIRDRSRALTEIVVFPERSHFTGGEPGWEKVADFALQWAEQHTEPLRRTA